MFGFLNNSRILSIPSLSVVPPVIFKVFPYVATLVALVLFSKKSAAPKASGQPF